MTTDFLDAFVRHRDDALFLGNDERRANADHLSGLAAECGLKAVMKALGMPVRDDGAPQSRHHRVHISELWPAFLSFAHAHHGAAYAARLPQQNPFADWSVHQRYAHRDSLDPSALAYHEQGLKHVDQVVTVARLDGRLT